MLRLCLIDRNDRDAKHALGLHGPQAKDARRRLLRARDQRVEQLAARRMNDTDQVGTIVHRQLRAMIDGSHDVPVVRVIVFAVDRIDRDAVRANERSRYWILRREGIRCAQHDLGATRLDRAQQIGGLGSDVQARTDAEASKGLLLLKTSANFAQYRHVPICPIDQAAALLRERQILDVMGHAGHQSNTSLQMNLGTDRTLLRRRSLEARQARNVECLNALAISEIAGDDVAVD